MEKSKTATGVDPGFSEGGLAVMHGCMAMAWQGGGCEREHGSCMLNVNLYFCTFFIAARFLLACEFGVLAIYLSVLNMLFLHSLDICPSSSKMMPDSCSDVFACSFFLKLSGTSLK